MTHRAIQLGLDPRPALGDLPFREGRIVLGEHGMRERVRADGDGRVAGESAQRVPAQAQVAGDLARREPGLAAQARDLLQQNRFGAGPEAAVGGLEGGRLLRIRARGQDETVQAHRVEPGNGPLEFDPPQPPPPVGEIARDEQRPGCAVASEHRPGMLDIVAVAVVEGQHREGPPAGCGRQPFGDPVEADRLEAAGGEQAQRPVEEVGGDRQERVGREGRHRLRADVVEGEDQPAPPGGGSEPAVGAARGDGAESGAEQPVAGAGRQHGALGGQSAGEPRPKRG